jgi:polar amino acid transport system substrate-binding protein
MNRWTPLSAALLALCLVPPVSAAPELTGSFASGKAPYLWMEGDRIRGVELDIVSAVLRRAGYEVRPRGFPNSRLITTFSQPGVDFAAGLQPADLPGYCHTGVYLNYHNVAITKRARHIDLADTAALLNYRVAIRQTLYQDLGLDRLGGQMPATKPGNFTEFASQDQQVRFFFANRADVIILDRSIFEWYAKSIGAPAGKEEPLEFHDLFPERHGVRAVFKDARICALFDRNLASIVADGTYHTIWASYGIEDVADPRRDSK